MKGFGGRRELSVEPEGYYQIPIQLKLGAARVYDDVRMAAKCGPDIIYLDGSEARRALEDCSDSPTRSTSSSPAGSATAAMSRRRSRWARRPSRFSHSALMALNCNKEIPGVTDFPWVEKPRTVGTDWKPPVLEGWEPPAH